MIGFFFDDDDDDGGGGTVLVGGAQDFGKEHVASVLVKKLSHGPFGCGSPRDTQRFVA